MERSTVRLGKDTVKKDALLKSWFYRGKQWIYRGNKASRIAKVLNGVQAKYASKRATSNGVVTLEVIGRKSGKVISFPLVMVTIKEQRYLVSMLGENTQWVRNVRAAGWKAVLCSGGREDVRLEEIPISERAPILKAYLQVADGARPHLLIDRDAPLAEFEKRAGEYPVFRLTSFIPS